MSVFYFYTAVAGFLLGIFVSSLRLFGFVPIIFMLVVSIELALLWRRRSFAPAAPYILALSIFLLCASLGSARFLTAALQLEEQTLDQYVDTSITLVGEVIREPEISEFMQSVYIETEAGTFLARINRYQSVAYGDVVSVTGTLERPEAFETDLGRTFNYPDYLKARGVTHMMPFADLSIEESGQGNQIVASLLSFKHALMDSFGSVIKEPEAGLGAGLLLGVKQALGDSLEEAFRRTGIIHIVVLSGYNVMLVAEAVMRLLAIFFSVRTRVIIGVAAISGFALMVGLTATVVRASIMACFVLVARATGRTYAILRTLLVAGIIMLLINPYLLVFDPGFQLSFLATLGLILVAPWIEKKLSFAPTKFQIREFLTATLATQIFVLPLLLYLIGEFSVVSVIVNVLVLPMVPVAMGMVFFTGLVGFVSPALATLFGAIAHVPLAYIVGVAERFSALPFASFLVPAFPFWVTVLAYLLMGYVVYRLNQSSTEADDDLRDWTIVEEAESIDTVGLSVQKNAAQKDEPPVFFR